MMHPDRCRSPEIPLPAAIRCDSMAPMERTFLDTLHARFQTPRAVIVDLVQRITGVDVVELRRVVRGYENEVYRVDLAPSRTVYVRIRSEGGSFEQEIWAMAQARNHGVPVPDVLGAETITVDSTEHGSMVIAPAPGAQLQEVLPRLTGVDRRTAMFDLGRTASPRLANWPTIHDARSGRFRRRTRGLWMEPMIIFAGRSP